ncbi:MAG: carboxypeptidase-like regulatory domain-containing protein [Bacteroidetes bacterium]|nr:carboxypeptidase-like regulatory domain-containing protein [Bacteroidota bacterium]
MPVIKLRLRSLFLLYSLLLISFAQAQVKVIKGRVKDGHTDEFLPFASVVFKNSSIGKITDSSGTFRFVLSKWPSDSLIITSAGYKPLVLVIPPNKDTLEVLASLEAGNAAVAVVVTAKQRHSRGWYLWKKVVAHRDQNNIFRNDNFTYLVYNKLELDVNNFSRQKIEKSRLLKPFRFIGNHVDTVSEDKPILPSFFSETLSKYYFQKEPHRTREIIIANKVSGVKNEGITKYLGGLYQNIIIYANFIPVFDKEFISPISSNGDSYYDYQLTDTQRVAGKRFLHLVFIPKRPGENTFTGDCWIHDTTYAVQKVILHVSKEANINYVDKLSLVQEFRLIDDSTWFLSKDKFVVNLNPVGGKNAGFIARKTTTYDSVQVNTAMVLPVVAKNKVLEEVEVLPQAKDGALNWEKMRSDTLTKNERGIYEMIDSLQHAPAYKRYYNTLYFLTTGYKNIGKFQIGPWLSWISGDSLEGTRVRFDLGTNKNFSKTIYLHGYLAYGFTDKRFKGMGEALVLLKKEPWQTLHISYTDDLDRSQHYNNGIPADNALALAVRKKGIPAKFINLQQEKLEYLHDSKIGLSAEIGISHQIFTPLKNLPDKTFFPVTGGNPLTATTVSLKLRFAYLEKFYNTNFFRYSLGSTYPIPEIEFTAGIKNILHSSYNYQKISGNVSQQFSVAPLGKISYNVFAGKIFGTLPYPLLEVHPGNELYLYNKYAFNLMNRYEFISDRYAGFTTEHNIGNGLFRFVPFTRKLKFRQFWNIKGVTGTLSEANGQLNLASNPLFKSLNNKLYLELGTGVDNIFKLFRVDFVWRLAPTPLPDARAGRFGIFGSFKVQL